VSAWGMAKPLVDEAIDQDPHLPPRGSDAFPPAALPLSRQTLDYTAGIIWRHRKRIGSCWRKLNPGRQALLVPAYLRKGDTFAELAAGFGIGTATARRYVTETVALLAARAPKPGAAGRQESRARLPSHRRHLNSHRPGRLPRRGYGMGVRPAARRGA